MPQPIASELMRAYNATIFVVFSETELPLRVGVLSSDADLLLVRHGAESAAVVTAWNPFSQTLSPDQNSARQASLTRAVEQAGLAWLTTEGRDPDGKWPSEQSLCVFDAPGPLVKGWMRQFGQNAILSIRRGQAPVLDLHPDLL